MAAILPIFLTALFVGIAFFHYDSPLDFHPVITYFIHEFGFIFSHLAFFVWGFILLSFFLMRSYKVQKKFSPVKKYLFSLFHLSLVTTASFFLALGLLFVIAWVQLNIYSFFVTGSPGFLGITTDTSEIIEQLKHFDQPLRIVVNDEENKKVVLAVAYASSGRDNYYGKYVVSSIPGSFILPLRKLQSNFALVDDELIISTINRADLQAISPIIGYLLVKQYFPTRVVKSYPQVAILKEDDYVAYRKADAKKRIASLETQLTKLDEATSTLSAQIKQSQDFITDNDSKIQNDVVDRDIEVSRCERGTASTSATPKSGCTSITDDWNQTITPGKLALASEKDKLATSEALLKEYNYNLALLKNVHLALQGQEANLAAEIGVFLPPASIGIDLKNTNTSAIIDYFATIAHEYLHYASFTPGRKFITVFFEEGLTEYFARQTVKRGLGFDTNLGYPIQVKIIQQLTTVIPESELAQIYFTKDELGLQQAINRVFGDDFYKNNILLFETLQYTGKTSDVVKLANIIMKKIGGPVVTEKDTKSTFTDVE